ncbi:MAG: hypothetical protein H0U19_00845 [Acidobacteria bacterium]|nr:hypothetical protein [Acidobacteriota bacterium]
MVHPLTQSSSPRPPPCALTAGGLSESVPPGPLDVYGETKLEGERLLERFAAPISARCVAGACLQRDRASREESPVADVTALREDFGSTPFRDVESSLAELLERT